ncbi:MAG: hypothetical protein MUO76_00620, partial [Anaerolineaceae bacterium]|nr:hypothetical protein [Anaerolineaceae bacterium]
MENWNVLLAIITGLVLRIGLPIAATALVIFFLRKLDNRWREEASQNLLVPVAASAVPCWKTKNCSQELRQNCPASKQTASPCWQIFRSAQGTL